MTIRPLACFALLVACSGTTEHDALIVGDDPNSLPRRADANGGERANLSPAPSDDVAPSPNGSDAGARISDAGRPDSSVVAPPPASPPTPSCKLDTRAVYIQGGRKIESITAYGTYWSREVKADGSAVEAAGFPHSVASEPKFASGPCNGVTGCELDTRAIFFDAGTKFEWTTAYGRAWQWTFDSQGAPVNTGGTGTSIASVSAWANGPCAYAGNATCRFDTRTFETRAEGRIETITAYGRWFENLLANGERSPRAGSGAYLESISRFAAGPCAAQPLGACVLDTRTIYLDLDGTRIEEVTARDRLWVNRLSSSDVVVAKLVDGDPIAATPRLVGPCSH